MTAAEDDEEQEEDDDEEKVEEEQKCRIVREKNIPELRKLVCCQKR